VSVPQGQFNGVSCVTSTFCVAAGRRVTGNGATKAMVQSWNGHAWALSDASGLRSLTSLSAVSCTSASACMTVGSTGPTTAAARWNGRTWLAEKVPAPANAETDAILNGVSCRSPSACIAAGSYADENGDSFTLTESWNGKKWSILPPATNGEPQDSVLNGVWCSSASACTAVGGDAQSVPIAERWDGITWTQQTVPGDTPLSAVSCPSAQACTAVGGGIAERWDGSVWSAGPVASPAGARSVSLTGVTCDSAAACTAVGSYQNAAGRSLPLAESGSGTTWVIHAPASPAAADGTSLNAVSCTSAPACTAAGGYSHGAFTAPPLAERWNGTKWAIQPTSIPPGMVGSDLSSVSCTSATRCIAAGAAGDDREQSLAEAWNGKTWAIQPTPGPAGADSFLTTVSCSSHTACAAVGASRPLSGGSQPRLAEIWNGKAWAITHTPTPAGAERTTLTGVSCVSRVLCVAIGFYGTHGNAGSLTLAEVWNGTRWAVRPTPSPSGPPNATSILNAVSCASATSCTAVGYFQAAPDVDAVTLAERWNGTTWAIQPTRNPAPDNRFNAVSCASATSCMAVGDYFAESWNGHTWTSLTVAKPSGPQTDFLFGVSCASARACAAVGENGAAGVRLAVTWNGARWSLQPTHDPGGLDSELRGVSCISATACTAVGNSVSNADTLRTLVERS
jgi:hypothetical protein